MDKEIELNKIIERFMKEFNVSEEELGRFLEELKFKEKIKHKFD